MNAVVGVSTAKVKAETKSVMVVIMVNAIFAEPSMKVYMGTPTASIMSIGGTSLSAVAPDNDFMNGGLAEAA